jgi:hypothetical protein
MSQAVRGHALAATLACPRVRRSVEPADTLADASCVGPARSISKTEYIQNVKHNLDTHENGINPYTIEKKNVLVRVFGDMAVVIYVKEYRQTPDTSKFSAKRRH